MAFVESLAVLAFGLGAIRLFEKRLGSFYIRIGGKIHNIARMDEVVAVFFCHARGLVQLGLLQIFEPLGALLGFFFDLRRIRVGTKGQVGVAGMQNGKRRLQSNVYFRRKDVHFVFLLTPAEKSGKRGNKDPENNDKGDSFFQTCVMLHIFLYP